MIKQGIKLADLPRVKGKYLHLGILFSLNKPIKSTAKGKKLMVLASKNIGGERWVKLIHFGALGYGHNYSEKAKRSYLARSAKIRDKSGKLTKNDPWSANHWARKILWPANKPAHGPRYT
jgi:hypothetical protein